MAWSYVGPTASERDAVRFQAGDTDPADPLVSDEEVEYALQQEGTVLAAAAAVCEALAARFSRQVDKGVASARYSLSQRAKAFSDRAAALRRRAMRHAAPYAGGLSRSEKQARTQDPDATQPTFRRGLHDHPDTARE